MYATNPCIVDAARGLYLVRVTPLTIGCSALPVATVLSADYSLNSWTVLARLHAGRSGALNSSSWSILARVQNSQDARAFLVLAAAARTARARGRGVPLLRAPSVAVMFQKLSLRV